MQSALIKDNAKLAKYFGVQTIIWRGKIWSSGKGFTEREYTRGGKALSFDCKTGKGDKTQGHFDHRKSLVLGQPACERVPAVHIDLNKWGAECCCNLKGGKLSA